MWQLNVPATLSNLGAGFDVLGMALDLHNTMTLAPLPLGMFRDGDTEVDPTAHLVFRTALDAGQAFGHELPHGLALRQIERIPRSRGLGSSATARIAGLLAWCRFSGVRPPDDELLCFLAQAEGHPDNVVAAMLGGVAWSTGGRPWASRRFDPPAHLRVALAIPDRPVSTDAARGALPKNYPRADLVFNTRRLAFLLDGLRTGDAESLALGSEDRVHQSFRAPLIGPVDEAIAAARVAGAAAAFISGSGSTLAALIVDATADADEVARALASPFAAQGVRTVVTTPHPVGAFAASGL